MSNNFELNIPQFIYTDPQVQKQTAITEELFKMKDQMNLDANRIVSGTQGHGFAAEHLAVGNLNASLIDKGSNFRFVRADDLSQYGTNHQQVDLVLINQNNKIVAEFQQKFCKTPESTLKEIMNSKYDQVNYLVPDDQHAEIINIAKTKKLEALKNGDHQLAKRYDQRIKNTHQSGTTYTDSKGKFFTANKSILNSIGKESLDASIQGAKVGSIIGGGISAIKHGHRLINDKNYSVQDFAKDVAIDTSKTAIHQGAVQGLGVVIKHTLTNTVLKETTKQMTTKNVVQQAIFKNKVAGGSIAIATAAIDAGQVIHRFMTNESMTKAELAQELGHVAVASTGAYLGGIAGTIIPIPVVGTMIGSMVGYLSASVVYQGVTNAKEVLGFNAVADARARREHVQAMCIQAIPAMRAYRMQLEAQIEQERIQRQQNIIASFNLLEQSLFEWNPDKVIQSMSILCETFNSSLNLQFSNFQEFDAFMLDKNTALDF